MLAPILSIAPLKKHKQLISRQLMGSPAAHFTLKDLVRSNPPQTSAAACVRSCTLSSVCPWSCMCRLQLCFCVRSQSVRQQESDAGEHQVLRLRHGLHDGEYVTAKRCVCDTGNQVALWAWSILWLQLEYFSFYCFLRVCLGVCVCL